MSNDDRADDRGFLGNLCPHLKPLVESMLAGGAHVVGVTTILRTRYALELTKGLTPGFAAEQARRLELEFTRSDDPHHPIEFFLICHACKQGIEWPQSESVVDRLRTLPDLSIN